MRVAIVGAGAIGSTYAWFLVRAGHEVAVLDVRIDHLSEIARRGLVAELPGGETVAVPVSTDRADLGRAEIAIVAVKAFATADAARDAAPLLAEIAPVATVQNGLGNDRVLARVFGEGRVVPGSTTVAAEGGDPGCVLIAESVLAGRSHTTLGKPRGAERVPPAVEALAEALSDAGLPAGVHDEVDAVIWRKLVLAGSMAPLSAALGLTVAGTMANAAAVGLLRRLVAEIAAVATAGGVELEMSEAWELCEATFAALGEHRASMAVDIAEGRRTEIDAMCVEVARLGGELGVPTPVNDVVGELVRALEASARYAA